MRGEIGDESVVHIRIDCDEFRPNYLLLRFEEDGEYLCYGRVFRIALGCVLVCLWVIDIPTRDPFSSCPTFIFLHMFRA
jgi:hypothetical protein